MKPSVPRLPEPTCAAGQQWCRMLLSRRTFSHTVFLCTGVGPLAMKEQEMLRIVRPRLPRWCLELTVAGPHGDAVAYSGLRGDPVYVGIRQFSQKRCSLICVLKNDCDLRVDVRGIATFLGEAGNTDGNE